MSLSWRTAAPVAFGLSGLLGHAACHAEQGDVELSLQRLQRRSVWTESSAEGRRLLREQGPLHGWDLGVQRTLPWGSLRLNAQHTDGTRAYAGTTTSGMPVQTDVRISESSLTGSIRHHLFPHWDAVASLESTWVRRHLDSVGTIQGYTEHWHWIQAMAGVTATWSIAQGLWQATAEIGGPLRSTMRTQLPGSDEITLTPRPRRAWRIQLETRSSPMQWGPIRANFHAGVSVQERVFGASDPVPLYADGRLKGAALQPDTRLNDQTLQLGLTGQW